MTRHPHGPGGAVPDPEPDALALLAARARDDLARTAHPRMPWLEPRTGPDGLPALDVLVVGGGQSGVAVACALLRAQVTNILVADRAARDAEGPWLSYARMHTLRSPRDYTGPDLGLPSLGYQAWHEARHGAASWERLELIARRDWAEYLAWVRDTCDVPLASGTTLLDVAPDAGGLIAATLRGPEGERVRFCRKLVLATGQEGAGAWWMPPFVAALPAALRAHAADPIGFDALRGRRVAVLGAGASALDNAACALEAGAARVDLFCRRAEPQLVQPYRWLTFAGFLRHLADLDDAWRWRLMSHVLGLREGFPQATWDRCARHPGFRLHAGRPWTGARAVREEGRDAVELDTPGGTHRADFLVCGTGVAVDLSLRPELSRVAPEAARWCDRYVPPPEERDPERDARLGLHPYLAPDHALVPRVPGRAGWLRDVHLFNIGATLSLGPSASSINAMTTAVPRLVHGLTRGLFEGDLERHWGTLRAYDVPQAVIR